jgi:glycosyltransferase involved in cell wall biosynthesis
MRVALERTALELDTTGTARAIGALQAALDRRTDVSVVPVAQPRWLGRGRIGRGLARELAWLPFALGRSVRGLAVDLLHCPAAVAPPRDPGLPFVVTVYDALAVRHPEWFTRSNVAAVRWLLPRALRNAALVVTATEFGRADVVEAFGVEAERVRAIPLGVDARFSPGEGPRRARPYLLTVGTLQPRKNIGALLRAFEALVARGLEHDLVVAGARGWGDEPLAAAVRASPAADRIELTGRVDDEQLVGLYRGAAAFVFPSRYEGFGLPPLEAMACGTPVVCSDRTSLPEVTGGAALLVDPDDPEALAAAIDQALDPECAAGLRERGLAQAARFTWEACAEAHVTAYRWVTR